MKKTILTLLTSICMIFCVYAQTLTVGKNSIQILDKLPTAGTLYTVVYKVNNSLFTNAQIIADAKTPTSNVYSKSINTLLGDSLEFIIKCNVANNATSTPVNYWVSYVFVNSSTQESILRLSKPISVKRRQTDEFFTCKTYIKGTVLQAPFKSYYLMYAPESFYHTTKKFGLIIACHGNGQKGTNKLSLLRATFLPQKLESTAFNIDFITINPQTNGSKPAWNNAGWFKEMYDSLKVKYKDRIDTTEVYILGYSGGGEGVSTWAKNFYISGAGTFAPVIKMTPSEKCKLSNKKVWGYHCLDDGTISPNTTKNLIADINKCIPATTIKPRVTYYTTGGHQPFDQAFRTDSLFQFFLGNIK